MHTIGKNQRGSVTIIVLAVILMILLGLIALKLTDKATNKPGEKEQTTTQNKDQTSSNDSSTDTSSSDSSGLGSLQRNARNVARKNDASRLASATLEYVANNVGLMPTGFDKGYLTGGSSPSPVEFNHYDTTRVEIGEHAAVTKDEIILVTGGSCGQNGTAIESTSRSAAVLFATEGDGGRWDANCQDL